LTDNSKHEPIFGTNGIRGIPNKDLSVEFAQEIGKAIGTFYGKVQVAMGRDTRDTGNMIFNAVTSGMMSAGSSVIDLGILPTPAVQYYCKTKGIFGVVITASHNPPQFNGIKCIANDGTELRREDEEKIERIYYQKSYNTVSWEESGSIKSDPTSLDLYLDGIMSHVDVKKVRDSQFRVLVDSGNGASYFTTPSLLRRLGCKVVSLNTYPDGKFTSRTSEPKPENLKDLITLMKSGTFNLGIAHDGDADRAVFIDENGNFIDGDKTLTLVVKSVIKPGSRVVTPISSSDAIDEVCSSGKAELIRTRVGAPIVSRAMIDNNAMIGGEENGGIIFGEHQYCRDGAMTAALILDLMATNGKKISELISGLPQYHIHKLSVERKKDWRILEPGILSYGETSKIEKTDGLKIYLKDGWVLMRASGTEPIIRIYGQARDEKRAKELAQEYEALILGLQEVPKAE
jgi:phosphomannomutase/phosphoglucomutase